MAPSSPVALRWRGHGDFALLLTLFVVFRVMAVLFLALGGHFYRDNFDHVLYQDVAELSLRGYYPFVHYWMEYPPVLPYASIAIHRLAILLPPIRESSFWFDNLLQLLLLAFETGSFILVYKIARKLHEPAAALRCAWIYAGLFLPVYVLKGWYDNFPLFFLLLGLYLLLGNRAVLAGLVAGFGFMVKPFPAILLGPALRVLPRRFAWLAYLLGAAVGALVVALPFTGQPRFLLAYFQATIVRSSWETPWAILEGYYDWGRMAPLAARTDPASALWQAHPATLPWPGITVAFGLLYLLLLVQRFAWRQPRTAVAFTALTLNLLLLYSKGYSPQFVVYVLPFVVLLLPSGRGLVYALGLSALSFVEHPLYFGVFADQNWLLAAIVWTRTAVLLLLSLEYLAQLQPALGRHLAAIGCRALLPGAVGAALLVIAAGAALAQSLWQSGPFPALAAYVRPLLAEGDGLILADRNLFYYLHPFFRSTPTWLPLQWWEEPNKEGIADLETFAAARRQVWLVGEQGAAQGWHPFLEKWLAERAAHVGERRFGNLRLRGYVLSPESRQPSTPLTASFGDRLLLRGQDLLHGERLRAGEPFRLLLYWESHAQMAEDYEVTVQIVDFQGARSWVQSTHPLELGGRPTSAWQVGERTIVGYDLVLPLTTPPASYRMAVSVTQRGTGKRLPVQARTATTSGQATIGGLFLAKDGSHEWERAALANFGDELRLLQADLGADARPGDTLTLQLSWQALVVPNADYTTFVHLVDGEGKRVAQKDKPPTDGSPPTSQWSAGPIVGARYELPLPGDLAPGTYVLQVGLYEGGSGRRLEVLDGEGKPQGNYLRLGEVHVPAR